MMGKSIFTSNNRRTNIVKVNIIGGGIVRCINIIITLLLVPLSINYINAELYGVWLSLSSIATWFGFFDFGFGHGLRNRLTTALALNKIKYGKILVSTTYAFILVVFFVIAIIAILVCRFINWAYILNVTPIYSEVITSSFQVVIVAFCFRMVLQIVTNVCEAYQKTALGSSIDMIGNMISLSLILLLTRSLLPNLIALSTILCVAPLFALLVANVILFCGPFKCVSPSVAYIRGFVIGDIAHLGLKFFLIQIVGIIIFQATNFIISHFCGPEQVTVYNIAYKYLSAALMGFTLIQAPMWSAFNDAYAKDDYIWMRNIYKKLLKLLLIAESFIILLVILSPVVYNMWIGDSVIIPFDITCLVGLYMGLSIAGSLHAIIVNGMGKIKLQTILAFFQVLTYIPLVYYLASIWGLDGILVALIISSFFSSPIIFIQVPRLIKKTASGLYNE